MISQWLGHSSQIFDQADPRQVSGYVNQHVGLHRLDLPRHGAAQASLSHRKFASLDLCRLRYGGSVTVTSPALQNSFHAQVLLSGHCVWRRGRDQQVLMPGELLLINPDDPVDLVYSADCEKFIVKLPVALFQNVCAEQRWWVPGEGVRFVQHRYQLDAIDGLLPLLALICHEAESCQPLLRMQEQYSQIVAGKLLSLLETNLQRERGQDSNFERLRDWIEGHLTEELDSRQLADQAGLSRRSLYALFERAADTTPQRYVRQRKLARIHACLSDPACRVGNVTELALEYGFAHLGRFASQYREQFGELPSQTFQARRN